MTKIIEMRQERAALIKSARELLDIAEKEKRNLSAEENTKYENTFRAVDELDVKIERTEKLEAAEKTLIETRGSEKKEFTAQIPPMNDARQAFKNFLLRGREGLTDGEFRALQKDIDPSGGYVVAPQDFVNSLITNVKNEVYMMNYATIYQLPKAESLGLPYLSADPADPTWTAEISIGSADSTMAFGKRELDPKPLAQYIRVSNTLLKRATIDVENLVIDRLKYKLAVVAENAFLNGTGAGQPLGIFVASANGIPSSQWVSTGNTTTEVRTDNLINVKYNLKSQYWPRAKWIMHRDVAKMIRKLKNGEGSYIWESSIKVGEPDSILGHPVVLSEYAPNTFTTGLPMYCFGDLSKYVIAIAMDMTIQKLVELYAGSNQSAFVSRIEIDAAPILAEAFTIGDLG